MVSHNPKNWFSDPFHFHRSDTLRRLFPWILGVCLYAWIIAWIELDFLHLSENSRLRNVSMMHTLLGFVISFTLVFRTNTAYERWWEGRKLWGTLVNNSRNLAMKLSVILPENDPDRAFFRNMIPAYAFALKIHLRNEETRVELFDDLPTELQVQLDLKKHLPNQIASMLYRRVHALLSSHTISPEQLLFLNSELQSFTDVCGACERIKNTPIPYSYSVFIKKFVTIYIITLPLGYVFNLGYYVVPMVGFIFYVLTSLELIAEEIEEPFGGDANDLPLGRIARNIKAHINELI